MHAARIVPDHSSESAVRVRSRVRPTGQANLCRRIAHLLANHPWLHAREAFSRVDFLDTIQVAGPVEHDRRVAALSGQTRPAAARENRHSELFTYADRSYNVLNRFRSHNSEWYLPVVRTVHRIKCPCAGIERYFTLHDGFQLGC